MNEYVQKTFISPTQLPNNEREAAFWQHENQRWWNENPMRYDWKSRIPHQEFSPHYFEEIDRRLIESSRYYLPWSNLPFDQLIDYRELAQADVLEIGIGSGTHAQLLAEHAKSFTGIDITEYAITSGVKRFAGRQNIRIVQMDAEHLEFTDNSFDVIWSWGVIHHSSNTQNILQEIDRVLRPGGRAIIMIYHRGWFNYYLRGVLFYGLLAGGFFKRKSLHELIQMYTDGALARYYKPQDLREMLPTSLILETYKIMGQKNEILPIPGGRIKSIMLSLVPDAAARILTHKMHCGSFLVATLKKST